MDFKELLSQIGSSQTESNQRTILLAGISSIFQQEDIFVTSRDVLLKLAAVVLYTTAAEQVHDYAEASTMLRILESKTLDSVELDPGTPKDNLIATLKEHISNLEEEIEDNEEYEDHELLVNLMDRVNFNKTVGEA